MKGKDDASQHRRYTIIRLLRNAVSLRAHALRKKERKGYVSARVRLEESFSTVGKNRDLRVGVARRADSADGVSCTEEML